MIIWVGDRVRIKPFVHHFGTVVAVDPASPRPIAVESSTGYAKNRPVWLRADDVELRP